MHLYADTAKILLEDSHGKEMDGSVMLMEMNKNVLGSRLVNDGS